MADNKKPSEDPLVATDEVGGAHIQRVKPQVGKDGEANDVSTANPMPVDDDGSQALLTTLIGHVDGVEALLGTIDADTGNLAGILTKITEVEEDTDRLAAIETSLAALDNAIAGSEMQVDVVTLPELPAGTKAIGQTDPRGNVAHDAADSGNPIKVGGRARTALEAVSAQNDRSDLVLDKFGRTLVAPAPLDQRTSATLNRTNTESGQLLAAVENVAYVVTAITVVNGHATVGTKVEILDGETVKWKGYAGALGGGFSAADPNGLFVGTKNTKLAAKNATTGADVDINVSAYKIPA